LDKIKEKLPGYHPKTEEEKEKEKDSAAYWGFERWNEYWWKCGLLICSVYDVFFVFLFFEKNNYMY
jgi:hypothetical protein